MSLARWEPLAELRRMREDMDRLFGGLAETPAMGLWPAERIAPPIDVFEKDNNVMIKVEVPGLSKDDLEVTATEDSISLRGEFRREEEIKQEGFYRHERRFGKFYRTVPMPSAIKPDEVKAAFKDGVLEITAPKAEEAKEKEKKVPISE